MNKEPMSLTEIAKAEGVSHQAIAEILERAYKKIRKLLQEKGITKASDVI
jgi:DNA-directed RNA polymerase specialized sigma24 family protein